MAVLAAHAGKAAAAASIARRVSSRVALATAAIDRLLGRIDHVEAGAVGRGNPLAADEEVCAKEPRVDQAVEQALPERRDGRRVHSARFADRAGNRNANKPAVTRGEAAARRALASSTSIPSPAPSGRRARPSSAAGVPGAIRSAAISLGR